MKLKDMPLEQAKKIILYGKPGIGKSAFVLTGGERLQFIDLDGNGCESGKNLQDDFTSQRLEADVVQFNESDPSKALAFTKFYTYIQDIYKQCQSGSFAFKILAIDSLTILCDYALRHSLQKRGASVGSTPQTISKNSDYMSMITDVGNVMILLKSLPIHVILVAHEKEIELTDAQNNPLGSKLDIGVPGDTLNKRLNVNFGEIWHMRSSKLSNTKYSRFIEVDGNDNLVARSRANVKNNTPTDIGLIEMLKLTGAKF